MCHVPCVLCLVFSSSFLQSHGARSWSPRQRFEPQSHPRWLIVEIQLRKKLFLLQKLPYNCTKMTKNCQNLPKFTKICQNLSKPCPKKCLKHSVRNFFWQSVKNFFWKPALQKSVCPKNQSVCPSKKLSVIKRSHLLGAKLEGVLSTGPTLFSFPVGQGFVWFFW